MGVALTRVELEKRSTKGGVPSKFISDHTDQLEPLNGIMVIEKEFSAAYTDLTISSVFGASILLISFIMTIVV